MSSNPSSGRERLLASRAGGFDYPMNLGAARHARPGTSTTGTQLPRIALNSVSTPGENHSFGGLLTLDSVLCLAQRILIRPGGAWGSTWVRLRSEEHTSELQ